MSSCNHKTLVLLPGPKNTLRCRHCHLTIKADELEGGYCPECFDVTGKKHSDFEEIALPEMENTRYRCETCGVIINSD